MSIYFLSLSWLQRSSSGSDPIRDLRRRLSSTLCYFRLLHVLCRQWQADVQWVEPHHLELGSGAS
jgi:hypothetical protein